MYNTRASLCEQPRLLGTATHKYAKRLGILLGKTIESTVEASMAHIEPEAIKWCILATTSPTDILYRATLINTALRPLYNHVLKVHLHEIFHFKLVWPKEPI